MSAAAAAAGGGGGGCGTTAHHRLIDRTQPLHGHKCAVSIDLMGAFFFTQSESAYPVSRAKITQYKRYFSCLSHM